MTQDVGSDPTVGSPSTSTELLNSREGASASSEEDFTCTYCGRDLEEEFVELCVGGNEEEEVAVRSPKVNVQMFDLGEMSQMEEDEYMDMDEEPDSGSMDYLDGE